jgi:hypothetical protein
MNLQKFVIVSSGRTGSNFLVQSLNMHPQISCFYEVFNLNSSRRGDMVGSKYEASDDPLEYAVRRIWGNDTLAPVRGFKVFYYHCENKKDFWHRIATDESIQVIHLTRTNLFLLYLSLARAKKTGLWHPSGRNKEQYLDECLSVSVDVDRMLKTIISLEARQTFFRQSVTKRVLEVSYEGLARGEDIKTTFDFLDLDPPEGLQPFAQSPIRHTNIEILNEAEVRAALKREGYIQWWSEFAQN